MSLQLDEVRSLISYPQMIIQRVWLNLFGRDLLLAIKRKIINYWAINQPALLVQQEM
ncbi:MAG: hypothetical protein PUP91_16205 [Rhizonema sp. PD37]|nr:hypothetical protein [Rhizonema sp. PD37]